MEANFSNRLLLDWIEKQPTSCSFIAWSKAYVQLQTHMQEVGYPLSRYDDPPVAPGFAALQQFHFTSWSCNRWAYSLSYPVWAFC